jgi:hypothetical protein
MKNAIFTSSNEKYGDFLVNHWLKSLKDNSNLENIDIIILDYGLNKRQVKALKKNNAIVKKCKLKGHITCIRWKDTAKYLKKHKYKQIMAVDGGDIIFQGDVSELFKIKPNKIKACQEDIGAPFEDFFIENYFIKNEEKKIKNTIKNKRMINAGMIVGPQKLMLKLANELDRILINKDQFGPEQIAVNYILYKVGFVPLDKTWNFVVTTSENEFKIVNGEFYFPSGEKIKIVHNAGMTYIFRPIKNFGYGKGKNELKPPIYYLLRLTYKSYHKIKQTIKRIVK